MEPEQILDAVRSLDGSLVMAPREGSEAPEIAWGDSFFYFAPNGQPPANAQPYGTIVTKNYPDDTLSHLDGAGRWRVNIHVGATRFRELTGTRPGDPSGVDFAADDVFLPHPVYGSLGWVSVVNPGEATGATVLELLRAAHESARARAFRRTAQ
ncbi:hypothetical protein B0I08_10237 [Glaciihabitans tibetensis]|uniref:DUF6194 domain-containing protein n=1 Tax=Glaciihabitans tibetensis TaxID=1266600 RepID=A0A2T0VGQ9_9MICO|nr:DUF6194 family protein [Glaciihabitans tibetensis]PRY69365.1 hypothetical protein B0I08_10237 [Glaciihabitans tibetensis]